MNTPIIKKIELFSFNGLFVEKNKIDDVLKSRNNLSQIFLFDKNGNKIRENGYDGNMKESFYIEFKYDEKNNLIQKTQYIKYQEKNFEVNYLTKYFYKDILLIKTKFYRGDDNEESCYAINENFYNEKGKKIKSIEKDFERNIKGTVIFVWESEFIYKSKSFNEKDIQTDRHYVELNNEGQILVIKHNFYLEEKEYEDYPMITKYVYDNQGNIKAEIIERVIREIEINTRELSYDKFGNLNYQNNTMNGNVMWTEFRNIEYY